MKRKTPRRHFLSQSAPAVLGTTLALSRMTAVAKPAGSQTTRKIVIVGAHPDDPETMCGGAMALFSRAGHEVVAAYLTRGEAGIEGKTHEEAARIRTAEARAACEILQVRPEFLGQIDGSCEINRQRYADVLDFLRRENPQLIITHWPIDTHRDHRICSVLVYDAWLALGQKQALYYGEVVSGIQTQQFSPTEYLDITPVVEQKHRACFAHVSQNIEAVYHKDHGKMELFRGLESGFEYAEAFIRHVQSPPVYLRL